MIYSPRGFNPMPVYYAIAFIYKIQLIKDMRGQSRMALT